MSFFLCVVGCLILIPIVEFAAMKKGVAALRICAALLALALAIGGISGHLNVFPGICALVALLLLLKLMGPRWEKRLEKTEEPGKTA